MKILGDEGVRTLIQIVKERTGEAINEERFAELVNQALSAYDFSDLTYDDTDVKSRLQALENKPGFDPSDLIDRILALETADNAYDDAEVKARLDEIEAFDHASKKDVKDAIAELRGGSDETVQSLTKLKEVLTEGNVGQITEALEGYSPKEHSHDDLASKDHNHDTEYSQKDHTHSGYLTTESLGDYAKKNQAVSGVSVGEKTLDVTKGEETLNLTIPYATKTGDADKSSLLTNLGWKDAVTGTERLQRGLTLVGVYNNGYPVAYGNVLRIGGQGDSELLAQWWGGSSRSSLYYRSKRDNNVESWSEWSKLAFVTDNVASATKLQTPRTIWGQAFDGSANVSGNMSGVGSVTGSDTLRLVTKNKPIEFQLGTPQTSIQFNSSTLQPFNEANGVLSLGTTGARWNNIYGVAVNITNGITCKSLTQTSDARLKENVADYELPLAVIANAPSVTYNWKADGKQDIGGIAQYWEQAQPLLTDRDNEGMLSMEYGKTAYLAAVTLAKEMQKLQADNAALRAELAELRGLVKGLIKGSE